MAHPTAFPDWTDIGGRAGVDAAVEDARVAVMSLRRHPANRTGWPRTAAVAAVRAARASAALAGAPLTLDLDAEVVTDPILAGALRIASATGSMTAIWPRSPLQVLARLHTLAAADLVPGEELGRPRSSQPWVAPRLARLAELVTVPPWPAPVQVAIVHGELLTMRPFGVGDGLVARAAARLTMIATGLDPTGLGVPEVAHLRSESRYLDLLQELSTGDSAAAAKWIQEVCRCLVNGAREGVSIADAAI
jgi:hypothetical protein